MVDTLLTGSQEEFDNAFLVAEFPNMVESQIGVIKYLFNEYSENYSSLLEIPDDLIISATTVLEFQSRWKPETRAKVIKENGVEYYNLLHLSIDKTLVSTEEYRNAQECVTELKENAVTCEYFNSLNPFEDNIEKIISIKI